MMAAIVGVYGLVTLFGAGLAFVSLFNRMMCATCDCEVCDTERQNRTWSNLELFAAVIVGTVIGIVTCLCALNLFVGVSLWAF